MEPRDYLQVVRNGWRAVIFAALVGVGLAAVFSIFSTHVYLARAEVFVSTSANDATSSEKASALDRERAATYARLFDSPKLLEPVVEQLGLAVSPAQLAAHVSSRVVPGTALIEVTVVDASPRGAQTVARVIGELLPQQIERLERADPAAKSPVRISVAREAEAGPDAISPRPLPNIALGLALGLVVGLGWVLLRHVLEPRVTSALDVAEVTRESVASEISRLRLPWQDADSGDELRALCRRVGLVDDDGGPRTVALTSSVVGEGTSTLTRLLARHLTDEGLRVVVVEAGPGGDGEGGVMAGCGLTHLLLGRAALDDVLTRGEAPFDVVPHGRVASLPGNLLGSPAMEALLDELAGRFDRVLVDAPPVTAGPDSPELASVVDGVLFVVGAGAVSRDTLSRGLVAMEPTRTRVLGFVLNGVVTQEAAPTRVARRSSRRFGPRARALAAALRERLRRPVQPHEEASPSQPSFGAAAARPATGAAAASQHDATDTAQPLVGAPGAEDGSPFVDVFGTRLEGRDDDAADLAPTRTW